MVENLGPLIAAYEPDAYAVADALIEAIERIEVVERAYAEVAQRCTALLRAVPGIDGRDVPTLNLSAVKAEAQRALDRGIPAPLPRSLYAVQEDPTIRSAA